MAKAKKFFLLFLIAISFISGFGQTNTNLGTDFWIAFPPNGIDIDEVKLYITSNFNVNGNIFSSYPGVNQAFTVTSGTITELLLPSDVVLSSGIETKGIRITTDFPVTVYGLNRLFASTDAFLGLPVNSLGLDYRIISYPSIASTSYYSALSMVATQDGTLITIHNHSTGLTSNIGLNTGQTYIMKGLLPSDDLTGSTITSNYPISVFGSTNSSQVPIGCVSADHLLEMVLPVYSWGKNFVSLPLAGRDNSGDIFRILAAYNGTEVYINGILTNTINDEEIIEVNLTGNNSITTSHPALVTQFAKGMMCSGNINGDPFMMQLIPNEQFLTEYIITTVTPFTSNWVNVIAPTDGLSSIIQDGTLIPPTVFNPIPGTNFHGARLSLTSGTHSFSSTFPFGLYVYGWNTADSYGYPGGCSMSPVATVDSVAITPDSAYGILDVTNMCFTATVFNTLHAPVQNILVDFYVDGISPFHGFGYTDALGQVQFCYTQTGTTAGTDSIYAVVSSIHSSTSRGIWSNVPCNNPVSGGMIGTNQSHCGAFVPAALTSIADPSGYQGTPEYLWQQSTTSSSTGFVDIPLTNTPAYSPGTISQTTWLRRLSKVTCIPDWNTPAISNIIEITIEQSITPAVTITASANPYCENVPVTVTLAATNGGSPSYQWIFNGVPSGTGSNSYTFAPNNNDSLRCILTSSLLCLTSNPVSSNTIIFHPDLSHPAGISISASLNPFCPGQQVTFTAVPANPGNNPVYQWKRNGVNTGINSTSFTCTPADLDSVRCILTSNYACVSGNPVSSTSIVMHALPVLVPSVTINPGNNPICSGIPVTFTATPVNGGTPVYQWKVNGANAGTGLSNYTYTPANGDIITCSMTTSLSCALPLTANSNVISMSVIALPVVTYTQCTDTITTVNAKPIKLKGGTPLGGTYSGTGVNSVTGVFTPSLAGIGNKNITYSYTNSGSCSDNKTRIIKVVATPVFSCGGSFKDIRDNREYSTVIIGSQCWFAENLRYGFSIPKTQHQRDNCFPEKYDQIVPPPPGGGQVGAYQWDEMMEYSSTPGDKGLCPPGWHVPTEAEWQRMFSNFTNSAFAGSPLKYSGFSGFNAMMTGIIPQHTTLQFYQFASFYWTSTSNGPYKAWAHGFNDPDPSTSSYSSSRENSFGVRCLRD